MATASRSRRTSSNARSSVVSEGSNRSSRSPSTSTVEGVESSNIRVLARIRPRQPKELLQKDGITALADGVSVQLTDGKDNKQFTFDDVIDSRRDEGSQQEVFDRFGRDLLVHSMKGYNVCIFAYGHTGSGKTYTMLGNGITSGVVGEDAGILPRYIAALFKEHSRDPSSKDIHYSCEFYEVYNEEIRDLLAPSNSNRKRAVHVHPKHGVRIEGLSVSVVTNAAEALGLLNFGNQMRTVAATTMNERSSRSHAVFTLRFEKTTTDAAGKPLKTCKSSITFVDLAGREDQEASGNRDQQFREMCYINTSLFHLAHLISKISENQVKKGSLADFRNSKLTLLLSQALIGNSRTGLVATLAPLQSFFDVTLSTLQFAHHVKKIKTKATVNNKNSQAVVSELEAEIRRLRKELNDAKCSGTEKESELLAAQSMVSYYKQSWDDTLSHSAETSRLRKRMTTIFGLADSGASHPEVEGKLVPFFTKLTDDASLQGSCNFILNQSTLRMGSDRTACGMILDGVGIRPQMCEVFVDDSMQGVSLKPLQLDSTQEVPRVLIDGRQLSPDTAHTLEHGDCIILGYAHVLRLCIPSDDMKGMNTCEIAHASLTSLDVASALEHMSEVSTAGVDNVLPFLQTLGQKTSETVVETFVSDLQCVCPLIDEANQITKEVWGESSTIMFKLHIIKDIFDNGDEKAPELAVCVLQDVNKLASLQDTVISPRDTSDAKLLRRRSTHRMLGTMRHPEVSALGLNAHMNMGQQSLLYIWSLEKFLLRLRAFRDVYQDGDSPQYGFEAVRFRLNNNPQENPWRELSFANGKMLAQDSSTPKPLDPCIMRDSCTAAQPEEPSHSQGGHGEAASATVPPVACRAVTIATPEKELVACQKAEFSMVVPEASMPVGPSMPLPPPLHPGFSNGEEPLKPQVPQTSNRGDEVASIGPSSEVLSSSGAHSAHDITYQTYQRTISPAGSVSPKKEPGVRQNGSSELIHAGSCAHMTPACVMPLTSSTSCRDVSAPCSFSHTDLDDLRAELQMCRNETGRFIEEQNRLSRFFARVDGLLGRLGYKEEDTPQPIAYRGPSPPPATRAASHVQLPLVRVIPQSMVATRQPSRSASPSSSWRRLPQYLPRPTTPQPSPIWAPPPHVVRSASPVSNGTTPRTPTPHYIPTRTAHRTGQPVAVIPLMAPTEPIAFTPLSSGSVSGPTLGVCSATSIKAGLYGLASAQSAPHPCRLTPTNAMKNLSRHIGASQCDDF